MKIIDLSKITPTSTSHDIDIYKKTIIKNGEIPSLTTFGIVSLKPKQKISSHSHPSIYEVYFINKGSSLFCVNGIESQLKAGQSIIIEPGETHSVRNYSEFDCEWLYFGIAVD
jgi:quercetin dioxygenase-like cupin family protein